MLQRNSPVTHRHTRTNRRSFFGITSIAFASTMLGVPALPRAYAAALTKAQREKLTPDDIIALMKKGNERFRLGKESPHDYLAQQRASAKGQYPAAMILSCIDSRAPAETIMDLGIGDCFNARVAGNIANDDIIGSMEFACKVAGAKVVLVMGHTACGAIKGRRSSVLAELESSRAVKIVGAMYNLESGLVEFFLVMNDARIFPKEETRA